MPKGGSPVSKEDRGGPLLDQKGVGKTNAVDQTEDNNDADGLRMPFLPHSLLDSRRARNPYGPLPTMRQTVRTILAGRSGGGYVSARCCYVEPAIEFCDRCNVASRIRRDGHASSG
jgi:hypothetical protein